MYSYLLQIYKLYIPFGLKLCISERGASVTRDNAPDAELFGEINFNGRRSSRDDDTLRWVDC